ncbi:MAG: ATP synthase F1 subunit epsilon [Candidatus Saccharimonadales bacterium]
MNFKIVTLKGVKIDQEIYEVMLPTPEGKIAVFPDHEALVTLAVPGEVAVRRNKEDLDDKLEFFAVSGGVVEIANNKIRVLVDEADHSDDIIESESRMALERANDMKKNAANQVELDKALELVDRHAVRLRVAELRRRHRG